MSFEERLSVDLSIFGKEIVKSVTLITLKSKIWGAWKVLTGEAGIILLRINPKKLERG